MESERFPGRTFLNGMPKILPVSVENEVTMDAIPNEIVLGDRRYFSIFNFCVWIGEGAYLILYAFINAVYFLVLSNLSLGSFVQALSTVYMFSDMHNNNKMVLKKRKTWGVLVVKFMSEIRDNDIDVQYPPLWKAIPMIINHSRGPKCIPILARGILVCTGHTAQGNISGTVCNADLNFFFEAISVCVFSKISHTLTYTGYEENNGKQWRH